MLFAPIFLLKLVEYFVQDLDPLLVAQTLDHVRQRRTRQKLLKTMKVLVEAMVRDPVLDEVIGANALAAAGSSYLHFSVGLTLVELVFICSLVQLLLQIFHRFGSILVLVTLFITVDYYSGRQMCQTNRRLSFVGV